MLTNDELVEAFAKDVAAARSLRRWARDRGIPVMTVSDHLKAGTINEQIAGALGYRKLERIWEPIGKEKANDR